jgi:hypothetical protein
LEQDHANFIGVVDALPDATFPGFGGFLGPGKTRIYRQPIGNELGGTAPVRVESARAVAIIYKDCTAVGDADYIDSQFALRRKSAEQMAAVIAEMDRILADSEIHRAIAEQKNMPAITNIPSAERKFRQLLGARIETLSPGTAAERRRAQALRLGFYDQFPGGGPPLVVQKVVDSYEAEQAGLAAWVLPEAG